MITKKTSKNQPTLPLIVVERQLKQVQTRLKKLGLSERDVSIAVVRARRSRRRA